MTSVFKKCPQCGSRFSIKKIDEDVESQDVEEAKVALSSKERLRMGGRLPPVPGTTTERAVATGENVDEVTYQCSKCGHKWTETTTKKWRGQLPTGVDTTD